MLAYFVLFTVVGALIGACVRDKKTSILLIIGLSVFWSLAQQPVWGLVTLGELLLGYVVVGLIKKP